MGAQFDDTIAKLNADIEKMAPNMKAIERYASRTHIREHILTYRS